MVLSIGVSLHVTPELGGVSSSTVILPVGDWGPHKLLNMMFL